ncbi:hypothetical protein L3V82_13135 [Thiotrichales bacterium 19S3-7]|nr:hypothetical protein [Thiotrichales bacterium 19S3-7]MCF6803113.1 hypothetical protein [Thiotrichales bacterium 19S3-11]
MKIYITANKSNPIIPMILKKILSVYSTEIADFYPSKHKETNMDDYFNEQSELCHSIQPRQLYIGDGNLDNGDYISEHLLNAITQNKQTNFILYSATDSRCINFRNQVADLSNVKIISVPINKLKLEEAVEQLGYTKIGKNTLMDQATEYTRPKALFSESRADRKSQEKSKCILL